MNKDLTKMIVERLEKEISLLKEDIKDIESESKNKVLRLKERIYYKKEEIKTAIRLSK